ncbi:SPL family radical SAM protein [Paenibacillus shenyangensis]|uniref:SPL family radical SAM protein n=1 Tax=Paenibacillus sp. A9 TaxID=1284352 RepID=UPI00037174F5|nr:radical SAM protein [Paenibacillus sp. A9]
MTTEQKETIAKTILTVAKGYLDVGFTHSLNPYSGCAFACRYCYVRELPIQRYKDKPWGEWVDMKVNAALLYQEEVRKLRAKDKSLHLFMSSVTDPYQPAEQQAGITRELLKAMLNDPPDTLQIQTRSPLITRDIDLLKELNKHCSLLVSMTIETDREDVRRIFAPHAPGIPLRIKALQQIREADILTQASLSPVLPFTPDFPTLLKEAADRIWIDTLLIGDGARGSRSEKIGMRALFKENELQKWYTSDIHLKVRRHFQKSYPDESIKVSQNEAFPYK